MGKWEDQAQYPRDAQCPVKWTFVWSSQLCSGIVLFGAFSNSRVQVESKAWNCFVDDCIEIYWGLQLPYLTRFSFLTHFCTTESRTVIWGFKMLACTLKNGRTKYCCQRLSLLHEIWCYQDGDRWVHLGALSDGDGDYRTTTETIVISWSEKYVQLALVRPRST